MQFIGRFGFKSLRVYSPRFAACAVIPHPQAGTRPESRNRTGCRATPGTRLRVLGARSGMTQNTPLLLAAG